MDPLQWTPEICELHPREPMNGEKPQISGMIRKMTKYAYFYSLTPKCDVSHSHVLNKILHFNKILYLMKYYINKVLKDARSLGGILVILGSKNKAKNTADIYHKVQKSVLLWKCSWAC